MVSIIFNKQIKTADISDFEKEIIYLIKIMAVACCTVKGLIKKLFNK